MTSAILHGGDVVRTAAESGFAAAEVLDFSANINPAGLPLGARRALSAAANDSLELLRYPDWTRHSLRYKLAQRLDVAPECVVLGAGASALITDVVRAIAPRSCLAFGPAFAEYRRASLAAGARFTIARLDLADNFRLIANNVIREIEQAEADLVFINNPHNPSGALTQPDDLLAIVESAGNLGCTVVLDEAFIDYAPACQVTTEAAARIGVVAIRSLTKFYGCPALRIGYAVAHVSQATQIEEQMAAWPVGSLALAALDAALDDEEFVHRSIQANDVERTNLSSALSQLGLHVFDSAANFFLIELPASWPDSHMVQKSLLLSHRILVRDCSSFETLAQGRYIRVAVLGAEQNKLLIEALGSFKRQHLL